MYYHKMSYLCPTDTNAVVDNMFYKKHTKKQICKEKK